MSTASKLRLPPRFIVLDLMASLLIVAGTFDLLGAPLPGPIGHLVAGHGLSLVMVGVFCMIVAAMSLVVQMLSGRAHDRRDSRPGGDIHTVERRARW